MNYPNTAPTDLCRSGRTLGSVGPSQDSMIASSHSTFWVPPGLAWGQSGGTAVITPSVKPGLGSILQVIHTCSFYRCRSYLGLDFATHHHLENSTTSPHSEYLSSRALSLRDVPSLSTVIDRRSHPSKDTLCFKR